MYEVTYQKKNGEVFIRTRWTIPNYAIGEQTSMGWLVVDIRKQYSKPKSKTPFREKLKQIIEIIKNT